MGKLSLKELLAAKRRSLKAAETKSQKAPVKALKIVRAELKRPRQSIASGKAHRDCAQDSDTVSDDSRSADRAAVYHRSLEAARDTLPNRKRARQAGLLREPTSLHSDVLDGEPDASDVSMNDFSLKREVKAPETPNAAAIGFGSAAAAVAEGAAAGEEMAAVAVCTKKALNVASGNADKQLAREVIGKFEKEEGRPADWTDTKDIKAMMKHKIASAKKRGSKLKWANRLSDADAVRLAGSDAELVDEKARARYESRTHDEFESRASVVRREENAVERARERSDFDENVPVAEVTTSGTGSTRSAHSTTPAPGTEQRKRVEAKIAAMDERGVVVSEYTRRARRATDVPPSCAVQGRKLSPENKVTGALIRGDGRTVQSPLDYALDALMDKSATPEAHVQKALEQFYAMLVKATKDFYDAYEVAPEDSEFKQKPSQYASAFKHELHARIDKWYNPKSKENRTLRKFLSEGFVGEVPDERAKKLREKIKSEPRDEEEREALVDAVLMDGCAVTDADHDVNQAAKKAAVKWQFDAEIAELVKTMPDISDAELAVQQSGNVRPDDHILLSRLRNSAANAALYRREDDAPITLQRENESIYGAASGAEGSRLSTTGHETHVNAEARRLYDEIVPSKHMDTLRKETTRKLRVSRARLDEIAERAVLYPLTKEEKDEQEVLRKAIEAAEIAAEDAANREIIEHYGHPDAAYALSSACERVAEELEERTREDLDEYLREPLASLGERPCANGVACIGRDIDDEHKTVLRELLSLDEQARFLADGTLPEKARFCYLCELYQVTNEFIKLKDQKRSGGVRLCVLQRFKVRMDQPGGYNSDMCHLYTVKDARALGIVAPFVAFDRSNYRSVEREVKVAKNTNSALLAAEKPNAEFSTEVEVHRVRGFVEKPAMVFREASSATTH